MAELLVAVAMLGACAGAIVGSVHFSEYRADFAKRRALALALCQNQIDAAHALALAGTLAAGTSTATSTLNGSIIVTTTRTISLVTGYTTLYQVVAKSTWKDGPSQRSETISLTTYVGSTDA